MTYRYATERADYSDFAAGRVLYNRPGATSFPVRLASEVYLRGVSLLQAQGVQPPYCVGDPCCGTGYLLTVLGFLHGEQIASLVGSDIDPAMVAATRDNLSLLTPQGLDRRAEGIAESLAAYGKESHREALESVERLREQMPAEIPSLCFVADATRPYPAHRMDLCITDVPYGRKVQWQRSTDEDNGIDFIEAMLAGLTAARPRVVAVVSDKAQKIRSQTETHAYRRAERFQLGRRQITFLVYQGEMGL